MAFAAAAVVGARRGRANGSQPASLSSISDSSPGPNIASGVATCACSVLLIAGFVSVVNSYANDREEKVQDYDDRVRAWSSQNRDEFEGASLSVTASWNNSLSQPGVVETFPPPASISNESMDMQGIASEERSFHDAEMERGLLQYTPLRYQATFTFGSYYHAQHDEDVDLLPNRSAAPKVTFNFTVKGRNGRQTNFSTQPWALVYNEVVRARTPAPDTKCRREQQGIWQDRKCHVVKRLTQVCLLVSKNEAGDWQLQSKQVNSDIVAPGTLYAQSTHETYGCDPVMAWHPAHYQIDPCWGFRVHYGTSCVGDTDDRPQHIVHVTVRSAQDPFIRAEELTDDTLNFGLSSSSQRVYGIVMLVTGLFLCIVPVLWIRQCLKDANPGESRSLKSSTNADNEMAPPEGSTGIYGNRML